MSLQRQLLALILSVIALASFLAALYGYRSNLAQLESNFDNELRTTGHFLHSIVVSLEEGVTSDNVTLQNIEGVSQSLVYQVLTPSINMASSSIEGQSWQGDSQTGFSEQYLLRQRWRVFSIVSADARVMVAQPVQQRLDAAEAILIAGIQPVIVSLFIIALLVVYVVHITIRPIAKISQQIQQKTPDDLSQIHVSEIPLELVPILDKLNSFIVRLDQAFERERQLAANAAHELRTPISVMSISCHNLLEDFKRKELSEASLHELQSNVNRMAHVVEQILQLYRYSQIDFSNQKIEIDLQEMLQRLVAENYELLVAQQQTIELVCEPINLYAEPFSLFTLFENLLRNANKYAGEHSQIKISVTINRDEIKVVIEDSGIGVDDAELTDIWQRFYRVEQTGKSSQVKVKGSGLGLSIVQHIAELHHATLSAYRSELGGLAVSVTFAQPKARN